MIDTDNEGNEYRMCSPRRSCPRSGKYAMSRFHHTGRVSYAVCDDCGGRLVRIVHGGGEHTWLYTSHYQFERINDNQP